MIELKLKPYKNRIGQTINVGDAVTVIRLYYNQAISNATYAGMHGKSAVILEPKIVREYKNGKYITRQDGTRRSYLKLNKIYLADTPISLLTNEL